MPHTSPALALIHGAGHGAAMWHAKEPSPNAAIGAADRPLGGSTCTHTLAAGHSPFASQPQAVADILVGIACEQAPGWQA